MYTGLIHISAYVYKNAADNLHLDQSVPLYELENNGIKNSVLKVTGETKQECMEKLAVLMTKVQEKTNNGTD